MVRSNLVSISVSPQSIFQINITNTQNTATPVPFQQMIQLPISQLGLINPYVRNIGPLRFSYNGSYIPAWLESISNGVATIWVKLPVSIPANSSITIDMEVDPSLNFDGNYWGEAPELSSTYGQYDNGANVFPILYQNFQGTSVPSGWVSSGTVTINNSATVSWGGYLTTNATYGLNANQILDAGFITPIANAGSAWYQIGYVSQSGGLSFEPSTAIAWSGDDMPPWFVTESGGSGTFIQTQFPTGVGNAGTFNIGTVYWGSSSSDSGMINYANPITFTTFVPSSPLYIGINNNQATGAAPPVATLHWIRLRAYPPNNVMPSVEVIA